MFKEFDAASFESDVQQGSVLVDFFSKNCGPCKMLDFILKDLDKNLGDDVAIIQVPFEENPDLVEAYKVEGYPTLIMFKDGQEIDRKQGLQQKPVIEKLIAAGQ